MEHQWTGTAKNEETTESPHTQPPPPYEAVQQEPVDLEGIHVHDDGRISIDARSRLCRTLSRLVPSPNVSYESSTAPPPSYDDLIAIPRFNLNIVIQIVGSRGDVQPFIALGTELGRIGHRVRIATHNVFEDFVHEAGLEFYPIGGNPADLMAYMVKNPGLIPSMHSVRGGDIERNRLMMAEILHGCWQSCLMPDTVTNTPFVANAIIANPPSFAHVHCAQALGIPLHLMFTMPWSATRTFPHPLANLHNVSPDQDWINRVSYSVVDWLSWQGLGGVINDWRKYELELEPISFSDGPFLLKTLNVPYTYCWSPGLVAKPDDWPTNADVCGFFFRDPPDYKPNAQVAEFLSAGPPPIYIGFGSIVIDDAKKMTEILIQAIEETGVRAIISRGWSNLGGPDLPHILYLDDCPHEWLFQHVSAVVHHGGAGTTACGLRNGKPTVVVPFFGDQTFWGDMISTARAGPKPIPQKLLDVPTLNQAIRYCLTPEAKSAARGIAVKMREEQGVKAAVASFHKHIPKGLVGCDILPQLPACWKYKHNHRKWHLSKVAAEILLDNKLLNPKRLKPYQPSPICLDIKRWEPITGIASAGMGMTFEILKSGGDILYKPYEVYKNGSSKGASTSGPSQTGSPCLLSPDSSGSLRNSRSLNDLTATGAIERKDKSKALDMASVSARASGRLLGKVVSGVMVDVPLAAAEGFRVLPGLYGNKVHEYERVKDWKSGAVTGVKSFAVGMGECLIDPLYQPYKGAKEGGALGFAGGMLKGTFGVVAKMAHASLGLVAYPGQGIKRSVQAAYRESTRKHVLAALHEEGQDLVRQFKAKGNSEGLVIDKFLSQIRQDTSDNDSDYV
ncbi:uncharacterized protein N7511_003442 [Penicillium nucicola]|uniref:uncharacterized protein n=1 Tax=Penicillium nucicola TaxID=1850975 RepID=UPI0025454DE7|nr:uncharacterized protein N7511_003442 [Penicillium nucicola]KAJ5771391.1 hypothetical protein N7511_003442 [Penicillium nucicola]